MKIKKEDICNTDKMEQTDRIAYQYSMMLCDLEEDIKKIKNKAPKFAKSVEERIEREKETLVYLLNEE